jgi:hypothetical protein
MFGETPNDSMRHADLFDFRECPRLDPPGISETPGQTEAEGRPIVVRQPPDVPHALLVRRDRRECPCGKAPAGRPLDTPIAVGIIGPVPGQRLPGRRRMKGCCVNSRATGARRPVQRFA